MEKTDSTPKKEKKKIGLLARLGRALMYFTFTVVVIGLVISVGFNVYQQRQIEDLNQVFESTQSKLNAENENKEVTIEDLQAEFTRLQNEVESLQEENTTLNETVEKLKVEGLGTITGQIFPLVSSTTQGISQYQRICARTVSNPNKLYCTTASTLDQDYTLKVPADTYQVYSELYPQPDADSNLFSAKAFYSTLIQCAQQKDADDCDETKLKKPVEVEVKAGEVVDDINPIDWRE